MKLSRCLSLMLIIASSAAQIHPAGRQQFLPGQKTNTVTTVVTSTATTASTTLLLTRSVCASLVAPVATTPCRRKRQYWNAPLFFALGQDDVQQFQHSLNPTQVLRVEPSVLPEFRYRPSSFDRPFNSYHQPLSNSHPFDIHSSFDRVQQPVANFRVADPFFGVKKFAAISLLYANVLKNILTPVVTVTSTTTLFPSTSTMTFFTETVTLTLNQAACLPAGLNQCPAAPTPSTTTSTTTTTAATTTAATTTAATTTAATTTAATTAATTTPTTPAPGP